MKYVRNLHNADDRVESVSPQIGKANRVFIGVIVMQHGMRLSPVDPGFMGLFLCFEVIYDVVY